MILRSLQTLASLEKLVSLKEQSSQTTILELRGALDGITSTELNNDSINLGVTSSAPLVELPANYVSNIEPTSARPTGSNTISHDLQLKEFLARPVYLTTLTTGDRKSVV